MNSTFAQYHQRYNPNLIHDDDQELATHLQIRHERSRKISEIVLQNTDILGSATPDSLRSVIKFPRFLVTNFTMLVTKNRLLVTNFILYLPLNNSRFN